MKPVNAQRRIFINAWGSMGDVAPFLVLGQGLAQAGAHVTVLSSGNFATAVASAGLSFESVGTREAYESALADPALWDPERADALIDNLFEQTTPQLRNCLTEAAGRGPVLFVAGTRGVRAREMLSDLKVPIMGVYLTPEIFGADRSDDKLGLFPTWFANTDANDPDAARMVGFVGRNDEPEDAGALVRLNEFLHSGPPPVAFTFGTAMKHGDRLFDMAKEACRLLDCRAVFLSRFAEQIPAELEAARFLHLDYLPLRLLLPSVSALVFHGGVGTCAQALSAACPQVIVPMAHDQQANAARVKALGVGEAVGGVNLDAKTLAGVLRATLDDSAIRDACHRYASLMRAADGLHAAVDRIVARFEQASAGAGT